MSIEKKPGKGLTIKLGDYTQMSAFASGPLMWSPACQSVLQSSFGRLFPVMRQSSNAEYVTASLLENGREELGYSIALNENGSAPQTQLSGMDPAELKLLAAAISSLIEKMNDPRIDGNTASMLRNFTLPDPIKHPEMYRLYGCLPGRRKLAILWGLKSKSATNYIPLKDYDVNKVFACYKPLPVKMILIGAIAAIVILITLVIALICAI